MCGMHGHWSRTHRAPKHLTDLFQGSLKKNFIETNLFINMILKVIMLILMFLISLKTQITYLVVKSLGMINIFIFIRIFIVLYFQQIMSILFQLNYKL